MIQAINTSTDAIPKEVRLTKGSNDVGTFEDLKREIEHALEGLEYGELTLTVRDHRVVQIDRVIRIRQTRTYKI